MPQNPPPPLRPQPVRPASRTTRPPADPTLQQRAWAAVMLDLVGIFGMVMMGGNIQRGVYVIAVAIVIAITALWLAITALTRARRIGSSRPRGAVFAIVLSSIGIVFGGIVLLELALFWPQVTQFSSCISAAGTNAAQQACWQQFQNSIGRVAGVLGGYPKH